MPNLLACLITLAVGTSRSQGTLFFVRQTDAQARNGEVARNVGLRGVIEKLHGFDLFSIRQGKPERRLTNRPRSHKLGGGLFYIAPSQDGRYVAFHNNLKGHIVGWENKTPVWILNVGTGRLRRVFRGFEVLDYDWSPSSKFLFAGSVVGDKDFALKVRARTGRMTVLQLPDWAAHASIDSRGRVVLAHDKKPMNFSLAGNRHTAGSWDVEEGDGNDSPTFSSDGRSAVALTTHGLWLGHNLTFRKMDDFRYTHFASPLTFWSPNGRFVCATSGNPTEDPSYATDALHTVMVYDSVLQKRIACPITWTGDVVKPPFCVLGWYDNHSLVLAERKGNSFDIWRYQLNGSRTRLFSLSGVVSEVAWAPVPA